MPTEAITSRSTSTIDPELAMEGGEGESSQQQQQQQQEEIVLVRHDSDASSSSSTTTSTSSTINSNDNDNDERSLVVTLIGSIANLCSATLGAGILALPYAFYQAGILCGTLLLLISAWATSTSIGLLVETCAKYKLSSYEKIVERGLGYKSRRIVEVSILIFCCGTAVGYVIAVGDIMERIIPFMTIGQKRIAMSIVWLVAMLPLSCLKTMKSLECASSVGIVSIITLLVAATVHLIHHIHEQHGDNNSDSHIDNDYDDDAEEELLFSPSPSFLSLIGPANGSWLSVLQACPIFFYAFSCQVNVAQIFHELPPAGSSNSATGSEGKIKKMSLVTVTGVLVCGLLYASVSLVTLLDFGKDMKPNILSCYELNNRSDPLLHIAFLAMALAVVMAFPLNIFPARVSIIMMWENNKKFDNSIIDQQQQQQIICCGIGGGGGIEEQVKQPLLSKDHHNSNDNNSDYNSVGDTTMDVEDPLRSPSTITQQQQQQHDVNIIIDVEVDVDGQQEENHEEEFHFFQHLAVTLLLAGTALGFALVIPNISVVFGLLGGTTSSLLGFIVPGLLGLQLDRTRISCWVLVICGSIIAVLTTTVTVYSMFRS